MGRIIPLFLALAFAFILLIVSYSLAEERITLTTYYPAPYGDYMELRANQMAIGSGYRHAGLNDGTLIVSGNVGIGTANPQATLDVNGTVRIGNVTMTNGWPEGHYCLLKSSAGGCPPGFTESSDAYDSHAGRIMGGFQVHFETLGSSCTDCPESNWRDDLGGWSRYVTCCK